MRPISSAAIILCLSQLVAVAANNLRIYFVDVEGGAATLIVTPAGESMLVDTGKMKRSCFAGAVVDFEKAPQTALVVEPPIWLWRH